MTPSINRVARRQSRKLFGGRGGQYTAEEYHQKYAFPKGAKCAGCGRPPLTRCFVFMPLDELRKRDPAFEILAQTAPEKILAMICQFKGADGKPVPHVRISTTYACKACTPALEKEAAKTPSFAVCELHYGPGPEKTVFGPSLFGGENTPAGEDPVVEQAVANMRAGILGASEA